MSSFQNILEKDGLVTLPNINHSMVFSKENSCHIVSERIRCEHILTTRKYIVTKIQITLSKKYFSSFYTILKL